MLHFDTKSSRLFERSFGDFPIVVRTPRETPIPFYICTSPWSQNTRFEDISITIDVFKEGSPIRPIFENLAVGRDTITESICFATEICILKIQNPFFSGPKSLSAMASSGIQRRICTCHKRFSAEVSIHLLPSGEFALLGLPRRTVEQNDKVVAHCASDVHRSMGQWGADIISEQIGENLCRVSIVISL